MGVLLVVKVAQSIRGDGVAVGSQRVVEHVPCKCTRAQFGGEVWVGLGAPRVDYRPVGEQRAALCGKRLHVLHELQLPRGIGQLGLDAEEPHPAGKGTDGAPEPLLRRRFVLRRRAQRWCWRCLGVAVDLLRPRGERVQVGLHIQCYLHTEAVRSRTGRDA